LAGKWLRQSAPELADGSPTFDHVASGGTEVGKTPNEAGLAATIPGIRHA